MDLPYSAVLTLAFCRALIVVSVNSELGSVVQDMVFLVTMGCADSLQRLTESFKGKSGHAIESVGYVVKRFLLTNY